MPAPRYINPAQWSHINRGEDAQVSYGKKKQCSIDCGNSSSESSGRVPFATEADRSSPQPANLPSGGKGKAPSFGEGEYAGVKASRLAEMRVVGDLQTNGRIKQPVEGNHAVSDAKAAEVSRFFQPEHAVGRRSKPANQTYYTDPKAREKYRYYISSSGNGADVGRIPGTKRHASCPRTARANDAAATDPPGTNHAANADSHHRPASSCGSDLSQGSAASVPYGRPRSGTSVRSRSSVKSSAASGRSCSSYGGSTVEQRQGSVYSSRTSQVQSQSSRGSSQTSCALSARNLKSRDRVKFVPPPRSSSSATTSASGWSQMSSENSSSLYSRSSA